MGFLKLQKRILKDTGLEMYGFKRTYRSSYQAAAGGYSWYAKRKDGGLDIGSESTATELLKRKGKLKIDSNRHDIVEIW